uniref:Mannosyltransferase n=2 Tax=Kalmanozyma brasiliensis (strain GHG001) TaxID=1365824 RepID=V5EWJ7_KALBG
MLGHKEWRFAFYILPALNVVAAIGASTLVRSISGKAIVAALIFLQVALSWFTGYLSAINYPGGEALKALHEHIESGRDHVSSGRVIIHVDVLPAMTGVTLFQSTHLDRTRANGTRLDPFAGVLPASCESKQCWVYDKTEDLPRSGPEAARAWSTYTHLVTEAPDCRVLRTQSGDVLAASRQPFEPIAPPISSFSGLRRKSASQIKTDLLGLPKAIASALRGHGNLDSVMRLGLPVVTVEEPAVWLCRRKVEIS